MTGEPIPTMAAAQIAGLPARTTPPGVWVDPHLFVVFVSFGFALLAIGVGVLVALYALRRARGADSPHPKRSSPPHG